MPGTNEPVWVVNPDGRVGTVPYGYLDRAQQDGYRVATNAEVAEHERARAEREAATGGVSGAVNTVVEGVARTVPGVDWAANKLNAALLGDERAGQIREAVKARSETGLGKAAEVAATVGLTLASGGAAGAAKAAAAKAASREAGEAILEGAVRQATQQALRNNPVAIANRGAEAVRRSAEAAAAKALGGGAKAKLASKVAGYGAEGAAVGAYEQVKQNWSEAALGNEDLTAERLMQGLGPSVLLGSGIGAGLPSAAIGARKLATAGLSATAKLGKLAGKAVTGLDDVADFAGPAGSAAKAAEGIGGVVGSLQGFDVGGAIGGAAKAARGIGGLADSVDGDSIMSLYAKGAARKAGDKSGVTERVIGSSGVRSDHINRAKVLDELTERVASKLNVAAGVQSARRKAASASDISDIAKAVRRGPEANAQIAGRLGSDLGIGEAFQSGGFGVGAKTTLNKLSSDIRSFAAQGPKADPAALFVALNKAQEKLSRIASKQTGEASDVAGQLSQRLQRALDDEQLWGAAATMNRTRREAVDEAASNRLLADITSSGRTDPKSLRRLIENARHDDELQAGILKELDLEERALLKSVESSSGAIRDRFAQQLDAIRDVKASFASDMSRASDMNALNAMVKDEAKGLLAGAPLAQVLLAGVTGGPVGAAAALAVNLVTKPGTMASQIGTIENLFRQSRSVESAVSQAVDAVVRTGRAAGLEGATDRAVQLGARAGATYTTADRRKEAERKMRLLDEAFENPERIMAHVDRMTSGMGEAAPKTTAAVASKYVATLAHLRDNVPKLPELGGVQEQASPRYQLPESAIMSFTRRMDAATNPGAVIRQLQNGEVYPDAIETMRAVWPEQSKDFALRLAEKLAVDGAAADYNQLLKMSAVTGAPLAATMSPWFIAAQQGMHAERAAKRAEQSKPKPRRKIPDLAGPSMTGSEQTTSTL